jgi:hypothetical protein
MKHEIPQSEIVMDLRQFVRKMGQTETLQFKINLELTYHTFNPGSYEQKRKYLLYNKHMLCSIHMEHRSVLVLEFRSRIERKATSSRHQILGQFLLSHNPYETQRRQK